MPGIDGHLDRGAPEGKGNQAVHLHKIILVEKLRQVAVHFFPNFPEQGLVHSVPEHRKLMHLPHLRNSFFP